MKTNFLKSIMAIAAIVVATAATAQELEPALIIMKDGAVTSQTFLTDIDSIVFKPVLPYGVMINNVIWATRNVDAPGVFANSPEDPGKFYKWNIRIGYPATGSINKENWQIKSPDGFDSWQKIFDPSPEGWRLPSLYEVESLLDDRKVKSEWIFQNGVPGRKFTDIATGNNIFLPAAGIIHDEKGSREVGISGNYWIDDTKRTILLPFPTTVFYRYQLFFNSYSAPSTTSYRKEYGYSFRCVAE